MIQQIPLNKLSISPRNARRTDRLDGIQQLKADIEARGVLQNLIGFKVAKKREAYEITAGGRRLTALLMLAAEGKLPGDHPINVFVLNDTGAAAEASLAENFQRLAMNPADECAAFSDFMAVEDATVEDVARRFGVTVRFVQGRLRLAGLDATVFDALREGLISLDVAQAFASTTDTALQARVYAEEADGHYTMTAERIRRLLTQSLTTGASPLALLVGKAAYVAAGGRIDSDLFGDPDGEFWLDPALLRDLADARMAEAAATLAPGFAAVRTTLSHWPSGAAFEDLRPISLPAPVLTDDEQARLDAISEAIEGIEAEAGDDGDAMTDEMIVHIEALEAEAVAIQTKPPLIPDDVRETATAVIVLDRDGNLRIHQQLFVERGKREAQMPEVQEVGAHGGAIGGGDGNSGGKMVNAATLSQALTDELAVQRRDILRLHIASDPGFAIDLGVFVLADKLARNGYAKHGFGLSSTTDFRSTAGRDLETPAKTALSALGQGLDHSWTEHGEAAARFDAFRALPDEARAAWAGWTISYSLESTLGDENAFHNHLGRLLEIDSAAWWRPTAINYFGRVKKDTILAAFETVGSSELRGRYASAKKGDIAAAAEKLFGGTAIIEADVRARAIAWVPAAMTFGCGLSGETDAASDDASLDGSSDETAEDAEGEMAGAEAATGTRTGLSEAA